MNEVPTGTDNTTNYSVNNQGRNDLTNFTNNSPNNQGRGDTKDSPNNQGRGDTNNSPNNQDRADTSDQNDTTDTYTDNMNRNSNIMSEFHRIFTQVTIEMWDLRRFNTDISNNRSHMATYLEQLNQPDLPEEEITRFQQHYAKLSRDDTIYTEQRNNIMRLR